MKKFIVGLLVGIALTSSVTVFAAGGRMIEVFDNVKSIVVNNLDRPFDKNNRPFVYNGTTYVPLRFVADALDEVVDWDGKTGTILIGGGSSQPVNSLGELLGTWEGTYNSIKTTQGTTFTIYQNNSGELEAMMEFYPLATDLTGGKGKYLMSVDYSAKTNVIKFIGKERVEMPPGWIMVDFIGVVSEGTISGNKDGYSSSKFELKKIK